MTRHAPLALAIATLVCGSARASLAQAPQSPLARGDVSGLVGWMNVNKSGLDDRTSNDWYNRGFYGGGMAGWHWTDHHKTEIEAGAGSAVRTSGVPQSSLENNFPSWPRTREFTFRTQRIAIGQQYQFFRNTWFHPHVAAGVDFTWERPPRRRARSSCTRPRRDGRPECPARERSSGPTPDLQRPALRRSGLQSVRLDPWIPAERPEDTGAQRHRRSPSPVRLRRRFLIRSRTQLSTSSPRTRRCHEQLPRCSVSACCPPAARRHRRRAHVHRADRQHVSSPTRRWFPSFVKQLPVGSRVRVSLTRREQDHRHADEVRRS